MSRASSPQAQRLHLLDRLRRGGTRDEALSLARTLATEYPEEPRVLFEVGQTLALWGDDPAGALAFYDAALERAPGLLSARLQRALTLQRLQRPREALADVEALERSHYKNVLVLYPLAATLRESVGEWDEARRYWSRALDADPSNAWLRVGRARCLRAQGRLQEALSDVEKALAAEGEPDLPDVWRFRAELRRSLGDAEGAEEDLRQALRLEAER